MRILESHRDDIQERIGAAIEIRGIAVRDASKDRGVPVDPALFTTDAHSVTSDPSIDIVIEMMGGIEPAKSLIIEAMQNGKHVISANKELIASEGRELFAAAEVAGVDFYFEASVGGGIPIIRPLKDSLAGERLERVMGIVNGTTNFILTRMSDEQMEFAQALGEAEKLGYAELDPTADIEGFDAAAKLAILASIAFNQRVVAKDVYREGIAKVTARDIEYAKALGYSVKLLAIAESSDGQVAVRVHPTMIPDHHPLASVRDNLNAVFVEGPQVGELMFYGRGAGGPPTATAVIGDLVDVARNVLTGGRGTGCTCYKNDAHIRPMEMNRSQYYILLEVKDLPGVLARIAQSFANHDVSIKSLWQEGIGAEATLIMVTHDAVERDFQALLKDLDRLEVVERVAASMRVQDPD